jgi:hypothetical protein
MPGPITKDTSSLALGLAQIRVLPSAANIANIHQVGANSNSIGALASSKFVAEREFWSHESGFPPLEDATLPLREKASIEGEAEEISPFTLGLAQGIDVTTGYEEAHSGEIKLGAMTTPAYIRAECQYTFPDGTNLMDIIFPRAQVASNMELPFQKTEGMATPVKIEAKRADSSVSGGNAVWDTMPLGRVSFHQ